MKVEWLKDQLPGFDPVKRNGERLRQLKAGDRVRVVNKTSTMYHQYGEVLQRYIDGGYKIRIDKGRFQGGITFMRRELKLVIEDV